jgi:Fe-S-cluster-containing dehydrogenase component
VGHYDEPQCVAVCPVDCIISDPNNVESVEELMFKYEQIQAEV